MKELDEVGERWQREVSRRGLPLTEEERRAKAQQTAPGLKFDIDLSKLECKRLPHARMRDDQTREGVADDGFVIV